MTGQRVSVALATYNGARFVEQQLASLSAQTWRPSEVVVTDDGSSDGTLDIVRRFAQTAPFPVVVVENPERLGYARNFLKAAEACTGHVIAFCDQDDIWSPGKLQRCCEVLRDTAALLVHHNARVVSAQGEPIGRLVDRASPLIDPRRPWSFAQGFTQVFSRALLDRVAAETHGASVMDGSIAHDVLFFFVASCLGRVQFLDEDLADYRQHGANAFGWSKRISFKRQLRHAVEQRGKLYGICAEQARSRIDVLSVAGRKAADAAERQRFATAEAAWRQIEDLYVGRGRIYREKTAAARLKCFADLIGAGGYGAKGGWNFGPTALLSDFVLGCLSGRLLHRHGLSISLPDLDLQDRSALQPSRP